jgi:hypothetical protein
MRKHNRNANVVVEEIKRRAPLAAEVMERQGQAFDAERSAEEKLVALAVELAKPALPAVCSRVSWLGNMTAAQIFEDLWILENGTFAAMRRAQGKEKSVVAATTITVEEACLIASPGEIIVKLWELIEKQITGRLASADGAEKTAAKLKAIVTLLGEG